MTRKQLEDNLGRKVKIRLFDGEMIEGVLRKTGEKTFRNSDMAGRGNILL